MSERTGGADQVLGVSVTLTGWEPGRETDVAEALAGVSPGSPALSPGALPFIVVETPSSDEAERVLDILEAAGGLVTVSRVWMSPATGNTSRPSCPSCGSTRTERFAHAGPAARVNRTCTDCGQLFKASDRS